MTRVERSRSRKLVVAATVTGLCAAALATPALAEDGTELPSIPVSGTIPVPGVDATVADVVLDAVEEAASGLETAETPEDEAGVPEEPSSEEPAPVQSESTPPAEVVPEQIASTAAPTAPADAGSDVDTTADSGDTAAGSTALPPDAEDDPEEDEPPPAETAPTPTAAAPPTAAPPAVATVNVNVNVRIGSAGDNGAVTQVNTAGPAPTTPAATGTSAARAPVSAPSASTAAAPAAPQDEPAWYWEWDCLSVPSMTAIPSQFQNGSAPTSWTWIWNCADNSEQYRTETSDQYQQINTNVSIRISSPGNDGAVNQTNIAAGISAAAPVVSLPTVELPSLPTVELPSTSIEIPVLPMINLPAGPLGGGPVSVVLPGISVRVPFTAPTEPRIVLPPTLSVEIGDSLAVAIGEARLELDAAVDVVIGATLPTASTATPTALTPSAPAVDDVALAPHPSAPPGPRVPAAPLPLEAQGTAPPTHAAAPSAAKAATARGTRATGSKPAEDASRTRSPAPAPTSTSASAAGAGGSSGGGLPIFLALPFLVAVLDLARRVALDRATWPSGHRRRVPDTPG